MRISFVVLNYGFGEFVMECLTSLDALEGRRDCEVILVDNGSTREDREKLASGIRRRGFLVDRHVWLDRNEGFAAGMNAGIEETQGELVVALNSDTMVGERVAVLLEAPAPAKVGFLAVPLYDWDYAGAGRTSNWQADVTALTWYMGCQPVRHDEIRADYVLGPPGPAVVMTRRLIEDLVSRFGAVYDPHYFLYGEDVDLFLRARRLGYTTRFLAGDPGQGEAIWHIGSASTTGAGPRTMAKPPAVARRILDGMRANAWRHAGWLELPLVAALEIMFRALFYLCYGRRNRPKKLWELWSQVPGRRAAALALGRRPWRPRLLPLVGLAYRRPLPWARRRKLAAGEVPLAGAAAGIPKPAASPELGVRS